MGNIKMKCFISPLCEICFDVIDSYSHHSTFKRSICTVEANERAGTGEGFPAGGSGSGGAGPRLVPGPNPQCLRETAAGWPELPMHGQYKHWSTTVKNTVRRCNESLLFLSDGSYYFIINTNHTTK